MNSLQVLGITALLSFLAGYTTGHHQKTVSDNAKIVAQVVKVAKAEAKDQSDVEKQDDSDKAKIAKLEQDLAAAKQSANNRSVRKLTACERVSEAQGDASASPGGDAPGGPIKSDAEADSEVRGYEELRGELLDAGAVAERLRLQVRACQAQWPR